MITATEAQAFANQYYRERFEKKYEFLNDEIAAAAGAGHFSIQVAVNGRDYDEFKLRMKEFGYTVSDWLTLGSLETRSITLSWGRW